MRARGHIIRVEETDENMYAAIDVAAAKVLRQLRNVHHLDFNWVLSGRGFPKDGEDAAALGDFISELRQHLTATRTDLRPENEGKIVSRWLRAIRDGRRLEMLDVRFWVDLLKE